MTDNISSTLGVNCGMSSGRNGVVEKKDKASSRCLNNHVGSYPDGDDGVYIANHYSSVCLNDQGGNRMDITDDTTCTLRAEAHHPPCVLSAGFSAEHSAHSCSIGYEEEKSPTLRKGVVPAAMALEHHPQDSRIKIADSDISQSLTKQCGTGGNNVPLVMDGKKTYDMRLTSEGTRNARNNVYETDTSRTIDTGGNTPDSNQGGVAIVQKAYGISSFASNAMKSTNPSSGVYEADTARTIDTSGDNPACNQCGVAVVCVKDGVVSIEGNGSRPSHHGAGYSEDMCMYTLNTSEHHAVAYGIDRAAFNQGQNALYKPTVEEELQPTIVAKGLGAVGCYSTSKNSYHTRAVEDKTETLVATVYKDPPTVAAPVEYIVRRLTPTECARLQGFPDWWCDNLAIPEPTDADIAYWHDVFEDFRLATNPYVKPKSRTQIERWLKRPHSDSAEYRMWGNGVALPCVAYVLAGIVETECASFENNA